MQALGRFEESTRASIRGLHTFTERCSPCVCDDTGCGLVQEPSGRPTHLPTGDPTPLPTAPTAVRGFDLGHEPGSVVVAGAWVRGRWDYGAGTRHTGWIKLMVRWFCIHARAGSSAASITLGGHL
jgi:hypothetical protein